MASAQGTLLSGSLIAFLLRSVIKGSLDRAGADNAAVEFDVIELLARSITPLAALDSDARTTSVNYNVNVNCRRSSENHHSMRQHQRRGLNTKNTQALSKCSNALILALIYKETERFCQLTFQSHHRTGPIPNQSAFRASVKYRRGLAFPSPEIKPF